MIEVSITITDEGSAQAKEELDALLPQVRSNQAYVVLRRFRMLVEQAQEDRDRAAALAEKRRVRALRRLPPKETIKDKYDDKA